MSCNCTENKSGKDIVDLIRSKGKENTVLKNPHKLNCSCGKAFEMTKCISKCPHCNMTYAVTPCSQEDITKIQEAGINY